MVSFRVLGQTAVCRGSNEVVANGSKLWTFTAMLAVNANTVVSIDRLIVEIWDHRAPASAIPNVRTYAAGLRRMLGPVADRLSSHPEGYQLRLEPADLDCARFDQLVTAGRTALDGSDPGACAEYLDRALALFTGPALLGVRTGPALAGVALMLSEQRLCAVEWRADAQLRLDRPDLVVQRLQPLAAEFPLRERLHAQLMTALARCGRRGEALEVYRHAREALVEELGIEPGPELRQAQRHILRGDPESGPAHDRAIAEEDPATPPVDAVPRQLPSSHPIVGHRATLEAISDWLTGPAEATGIVAAGEATPMAIAAIDGMAGVGKTALAVHWARGHADRFPDGQLYVNLRGFDPGGAPIAAATAIRGFLKALAVPTWRIPVDAESQAALYRSRLAGRRVLVVLDNARGVEQIRPLLPGSGTCAVIVTSRGRLTALAATDGARLLTMDVLGPAESHQLLVERIGSRRVAGEPGAVDELIDLCGGLPLALSIAAARAVAQPTFPLAGLVDELRDVRGRLHALDAGDPATNIRSVFSYSYRALAPVAARMFEMLALHPGPDISLDAAAHLAGLDRPAAHRALRELAHGHLVEEHRPHRYRMHELLSLYARERLAPCIGAVRPVYDRCIAFP